MSVSRGTIQSNSSGTLKLPATYKLEALSQLLDTHNVQFAQALAIMVENNWQSESVVCADASQVTYDWWPIGDEVMVIPMGDLNMELYFLNSPSPSKGIGMHLLIVKEHIPKHVLFIGFHEFTLITQIIAGIGQFKLVRGDECRESKTRSWVMSNVDKLSHRIVTCLFGSDLKELYHLI